MSRPPESAPPSEAIRALHSDVHAWLTETDDCDGISFLLKVEERLKGILEAAALSQEPSVVTRGSYPQGRKDDGF